MVDRCIFKITNVNEWFSMYLSVFIVYFIVLVVYFNVLCCIGSLKIFTISSNIIAVYFYVFTIYFNVFTNIVIGILPSHFHYNVSTMCSHLYIFFNYPQWLPSQYTLPLPHFLPFPLIHPNFHKIYKNITHQFLLFTSIHY